MKEWIVKVLILALLALAAQSARAEPIERRLDAAAEGVVVITNTAGSVAVNGWSRTEVEVTGDLGSGVEELVFERDGDRIEITVKAPKGGGHDISSDLKVQVPEKSALKVVAVSADIDVRGLLGTQQLQSVSGDIRSEVRAADVEMATVSGDVTVAGDDKKGHAELSTVSGDIEANKLAGELSVNAVSGDLEVRGGRFDRARLKTTNGDIEFAAALADGGALNVETINGDLDIDFRGKVSARFDIETFNGDIRNCFGPKPVRISKYGPGTELKFTEGEGQGRVAIKTMNGDLRLCRD